jgi:CBS domain containing-hemolysin-like protein
MTLFFGVLFAGITLLAIGLQRTYYHYPVKELRRRARSDDQLAQILYKPVSYGVSLQVLLWIIVIGSAALSFVLLSRAFEPWFAVIIVGFLLWLGFLWLPSSRLTSVSIHIVTWATPVVTWVLNYLHPILEWVGNFFRKHRHISIRTNLYEKEDLVELLEKQRELPDNRIHKADIDLLQNALQFGDKQVCDVYVPLRTVTLVNAAEAIGPKLMDDLYKSGYSRFPVYEGEQSNVIATLYMKDLVKRKSGGYVRDVMREEVFYVHEDFTLQQALQAFLRTKHHLFVVVNSFEEFVGIITIEDILEEVIGRQIVDEFDKYEDMRAVAAAAAKVDHEANKKSGAEPTIEDEAALVELTDSETPDIVVK